MMRGPVYQTERHAGQESRALTPLVVDGRKRRQIKTIRLRPALRTRDISLTAGFGECLRRHNGEASVAVKRTNMPRADARVQGGRGRGRALLNGR